MKIKSFNPASGKLIGEVEVTSEADIKKKVTQARQVAAKWRNTSLEQRVRYLKKAKEIFQGHESEIAELISQEVGTPISECREEVAWDWGYFDWFLDHAQEALSPEKTYEDDQAIHHIVYEPVGVVAAITPWNLPFDLFIWAVVPNLLAGNVVIHKASEECILSGRLFEKLMDQVGLPDGVFQAIHGDGRQGAALVNQEIDMIWFTGSYEVGHKLYKVAAEKFIKPILELGGSNPTIILADADIDALLGSLMFKRFSFSGQTCDALKRLIVHESLYDQVVQKLSQKIEQLKVGDPQESQTQMGPLVSKKQKDLLAQQVDESVAAGAKVLSQGKINAKVGDAYYPPTLIGNIKPQMKVWKEEVFGPVLPVMKFSTEEEAIELANNTPYGLGSQIFTRDVKKATQLAAQIEAGNVDINGVGHFKPASPFGGYKKSGMGREHGKHGFRELTQIKLIAKPKMI